MNTRIGSKHGCWVRVSALTVAVIGGLYAASAAGCGSVSATNLLWLEATAGANGVVQSQGPGRTLTLGCTTEGVPCQWVVRMLLQNAEPLRAWSLSLLGDSGSALLDVVSFDYSLSTFNTPVGGETFGEEPDLLGGVGASSDAADQVPAGRYTLVTFRLEYQNPVGAVDERTVLAQIGSAAWADADPNDQVPPLIQIGANLPVPVVAGTVLPEAVIVVRPPSATDNSNDDGNGDDGHDREVCSDGRDNDGDGLVDCADPDCANATVCLTRPTVECPANLTVECDGMGNQTAVDAWLGSATAQSQCDHLTLTNDFGALTNVCGAAGSALVTWAANDSCGSASCSATLDIADTTPPTIAAPSDFAFVCDGTGMQTELRTWLNSSTASDLCGDVSRSFSRGATAFDCTGAIDFSATDECGNTAAASAMLTIQGDTDPPTLTLNGSAMLTLECGVDAYVEPGAAVADNCDATLTGPAITGPAVDTHMPGTYVLNYDAVDLCGHAAARLTRTVTVVDTRPPRVELIEVEVWPPNHEYRTLHLSDCARLIDDCEGELDIDVVGRILSAASSEPDNANGDGNTIEDVVVVDDHTFRVRAERQGGGNGRTYSIDFEAVDSSNQRVAATCLVEVPHDQGGGGDGGNRDDDGDGDDNSDG